MKMDGQMWIDEQTEQWIRKLLILTNLNFHCYILLDSQHSSNQINLFYINLQ